MELQDPLVPQELQGHRERLVRQDPREHRDLPEHQEPLETLD